MLLQGQDHVGIGVGVGIGVFLSGVHQVVTFKNSFALEVKLFWQYHILNLRIWACPAPSIMPELYSQLPPTHTFYFEIVSVSYPD